jgi:hypothetical protein
VKTKNRTKLARERAGLSVNQACKLLIVERDDLVKIEEDDVAFADTGRDLIDLMHEVYGVNPQWMAGEVPQHDYAHVDKMVGADKLTFHDRDILAEFAASMQRKPVSEHAQALRDRIRARLAK